MGEELDRRAIMKRLFIVVEGITEQDFVREILSPYFSLHEIYDTSRNGRGGFVNYEHLKNTITALLKSEGKNIVVTTLVDYFRIPNNTPHYVECMKNSCNKDKVAELERCIAEDIKDRRLVPYIQLHEFEALLFSNNEGFEEFFSEKQAQQTLQIVNAFNNPEDINTHPQYAPSKRILAIKEDYNKPIDGNLIALKIGIKTMLERCPRFAAWIENIVRECR